MKNTILLILTALLLFQGCGKKPEPLYEGLPMSVWIERLHAGDALIRLDALNVLCGIGRTALPVEDEVRSLARSDPSTQVKIRAIETLESMGAVTQEFNDVIQAYRAPLIPNEDDEYDDEAFEAVVDSAINEVDLAEHARAEDGVQYLNQIANATDSLAGIISPRADRSVNSEQLEEFAISQRSTVVANVLNLLNNPIVLKELLESGGSAEKKYAAEKLSDLKVTDPDIKRALDKFRSSADTSLIRATIGAPKKP